MKRFTTAVALAAALSVSSVGYAGGGHDHNFDLIDFIERLFGHFPDKPGGNGGEVPELDAGAAGLGIGLVIGLGALVRERQKRKDD